jgi:hypothetical protein
MAGLRPRGADSYDAGLGLQAQASRPWVDEYRYPERMPDDLMQGQQWCPQQQAPQQQKQPGQHHQSMSPVMGPEGVSSVLQQQMMMMQVLPMDAFGAGASASNQSNFVLVPVAAVGNSEDQQQFQPGPGQRQSSESTVASSLGIHETVPLQPHAQHAQRAQQALHAQQAQQGQPPFSSDQLDRMEMMQHRWQKQRWEQELEKLRLQQTKLAQQQELLEQCLQMRPQQRRLPQHPPQQMQSRQKLLENGYRLKPQLHQSMGQWLPVSEEELGISPRQGQRQQCPPYRQMPPHPSSQDRSQPRAAGVWSDPSDSISAVPVWATSLDQPIEDMSRLLHEDYHSSDDEVQSRKTYAHQGGLRHEDDIRHPSKASSYRPQQPPRGKQAYFDRSASSAHVRGTGPEPPLEPHAGPQQLHATGMQSHGRIGNGGGKGAGEHGGEDGAVGGGGGPGTKAKRGVPGSGYHDTMKLLLQTLVQEDPGNIFVCRKINAFGFRSPERLRAYFSKYGGVKGVYVSHSHVKNSRPDTAAPSRLRAASLGFVVMTTPEAVNSILAEGPEHTVRGKTVRVGVFYRKCVPNSDDEDGDDDQAGNGEEGAEQPGGGHEDDNALLDDGSPKQPGVAGSPARHRWADDDPSLDAVSGVS